MISSSQDNGKSQFIKYIIFGVLATATDFAIYKGLVFYGINLNFAKGVSFLCGTIVSYFLNKYLTFKVNNNSINELSKFIVLYLFSMVVNVIINHLILILMKPFIVLSLCTTIAFICATIVSIVINFFGQKYWVFSK